MFLDIFCDTAHMITVLRFMRIRFPILLFKELPNSAYHFLFHLRKRFCLHKEIGSSLLPRLFHRTGISIFRCFFQYITHYTIIVTYIKIHAQMMADQFFIQRFLKKAGTFFIVVHNQLIKFIPLFLGIIYPRLLWRNIVVADAFPPSKPGKSLSRFLCLTVRQQNVFLAAASSSIG